VNSADAAGPDTISTDIAKAIHFGETTCGNAGVGWRQLSGTSEGTAQAFHVREMLQFKRPN